MQINQVRSLVPSSSNYRSLLQSIELQKLKTVNEFNFEIKSGYFRQRTDAVISRLSYYNRMVQTSIVSLHYLLTVCKVPDQTDKLVNLLYKLGRPSFEQYLNKTFAQVEEFLVVKQKAIASSPAIYFTPAITDNDRIMIDFDDCKHLLKPVLKVTRDYHIRSIF